MDSEQDCHSAFQENYNAYQYRYPTHSLPRLLPGQRVCGMQEQWWRVEVSGPTMRVLLGRGSWGVVGDNIHWQI